MTTDKQFEDTIRAFQAARERFANSKEALFPDMSGKVLVLWTGEQNRDKALGCFLGVGDPLLDPRRPAAPESRKDLEHKAQEAFDKGSRFVMLDLTTEGKSMWERHRESEQLAPTLTSDQKSMLKQTRDEAWGALSERLVSEYHRANPNPHGRCQIVYAEGKDPAVLRTIDQEHSVTRSVGGHSMSSSPHYDLGVSGSRERPH